VIEVRPCSAEEQLDALRPISHYFGSPPTEESVERWRRLQPPERMHVALENGGVVGGAGAFPFQLTVPGAQLPCAGVTVVAVLPTHLRRGIMRAMMRAQLDDLHERGEPVAALWASDERIYGRYGYGLASLCGEINLSRDYADFADEHEPVGRTRLVTLEEALELFPAVYDRARESTPGMFSRSRDWWEVRRLLDLPERRQGAGEHVRAVHEVDGAVDAYAVYRVHPGFEDGVSVGFTNVIEAVGASDAGTREIWRFLLGVDWMASVKAALLPVDHPLFLLMAQPRRLRFRVADALWVRLVDVRAALSGRSYAADGPLVLEVADTFCPWNEGRWKLEAGAASRTDEEPDLRCDVGVLGSVYLGGFTFAQLARAGRFEELRAGAFERADALFRSDRAPWCPEIF
jgi:predicted acetyltransferase